MRFAPSEGLLELLGVPVPGMGEEFGRVVAGAGGPSFFIAVDDSVTKVEVHAHRVDAAPELDPDAYEEVVEFSCLGPAVLQDPWSTTTRQLTVVESPASHRLRLACRSAGSRGEVWEFWAWPAEAEPSVVLVDEPTGDDQGHLDLPEAAAGLAGAARIGRDVDRAPGCRTLSHQMGVAVASRVCSGRPSGHRLNFYGPHVWTRSRDGARWLAQVSGYPGWFPEGPDHPDQLVGRTGMLRTRPVTDSSLEDSRARSKPPILVKVNWFVSEAARGAYMNRESLRPLLTEWTVQETSFARVRGSDGGSSATLITVEHSGLPLEWVDDMRDWWLFQLAIQEHEVRRAAQVRAGG